jgi:Alpha/beta hydrolase domain
VLKLIRLLHFVVAVVAILAVASSCSSSPPRSGVAKNQKFSNPVYGKAAALSGPVTVGHIVEPESGFSPQLPAGYIEREFFASGTATAFRAMSTPSDGRWTISPSTSSPYETRIIVRRPTDPRQFNGTVVVEWLNVSAGESSPDWDYLNPELIADGYAYVGVSAQALGVAGGNSLLGTGRSGGLVGTEPARYASLHHPGDQYSYDIFAQIGRALRTDQNPAVLGDLQAKRILAVGESQSAFFLTTFTDAIQPETHAYDGLFIHSRAGAGAPLNGASVGSSTSAAAQRIRADLDVPVFMFETETDVTELGYASAQQPNTSRIRTWEVAGTAHADSYIVGSFASELGCAKPINNGPQHVVVQAAFAAFNKWVAAGTAPPSPSPFTLASTKPVKLALDANGNVVGGVRTPAVDVPVSTLSGVAPPGTSVLCSLFGYSAPFSQSRLVQLYGSKATYLSRYERSLHKAIKGRVILATDQSALLAEAQQVRFP